MMYFEQSLTAICCVSKSGRHLAVKLPMRHLLQPQRRDFGSAEPVIHSRVLGFPEGGWQLLHVALESLFGANGDCPSKLRRPFPARDSLPNRIDSVFQYPNAFQPSHFTI